MVKVKSKSFSNQDVPLDGFHYEQCNFKSCTFVFSATATFSLTNNHISGNSRFKFTGKAADTVAAMKAIYSMGDWGRKHVLATFQEIAPDIKTLH